MSVKILCAFYFTGLFLAFVPDTQGKTCWDTKWYNSSSPGDHGGSDTETLATNILNAICPENKPVTAAHCKDEKGEPFTGFKNDTGNHYIATCTVVTGLQCHPYNNTVGASCADFAIQYGCECPTTTPSTTKGSYINTAGSMSTGSSSGSGSGGSSSGSESGGSSSGSGSGGSSSGSESGGSSSGSGSGGSSSGRGSTGSPIGSGSGGNSSGSGSGGSSSGSGSGESSGGSGSTASPIGSGSGGSSSGSGSGESSSGNGSGGSSSGSGSGSGPAGNGSGGDSNSQGGNSALGGSCPCRSGSQKTEYTFFSILCSVLLKLYLF